MDAYSTELAFAVNVKRFNPSFSSFKLSNT